MTIRIKQTLALVSTTAAVAALASSCGSVAKPTVASIPAKTSPKKARSAPSSSTGRTPHGSNVAWARCMTLHGIPATPSGNGVVVDSSNASQSLVETAYRACRKLWSDTPPEYGPTITPAQQAAAAKANAKFAACMRVHGVSNFPDPNNTGAFPPDSIRQLDPSSPFFQRAYKTCRPLMTKVGPQIGFHG